MRGISGQPGVEIFVNPVCAPAVETVAARRLVVIKGAKETGVTTRREGTGVARKEVRSQRGSFWDRLFGTIRPR